MRNGRFSVALLRCSAAEDSGLSGVPGLCDGTAADGFFLVDGLEAGLREGDLFVAAVGGLPPVGAVPPLTPGSVVIARPHLE